MEKTKHPSSPERSFKDAMVLKHSYFYAFLIPIAFVVGLATGFLFWGNNNGKTQPQKVVVGQNTSVAQAPQPPEDSTQDTGGEGSNPSQNNGEPTSTPQVRRYDVPIDDDPVLGPDNALITIIEFSDYECPYCKKFHNEVFPRLLDEYGDKIRFVYRDFPLTTLHANATFAAEAANCAGEQDAYWQYSEKLFGGEYPLGKTAYQKYAAQLDLDMDSFDMCISSKRQQAEIMADLSYATELGVRSTPTFFLNGIPIVGAQPFEVFKQIIDKELAGELP